MYITIKAVLLNDGLARVYIFVWVKIFNLKLYWCKGFDIYNMCCTFADKLADRADWFGSGG